MEVQGLFYAFCGGFCLQTLPQRRQSARRAAGTNPACFKHQLSTPLIHDPHQRGAEIRHPCPLPGTPEFPFIRPLGYPKTSHHRQEVHLSTINIPNRSILGELGPYIQDVCIQPCVLHPRTATPTNQSRP